MKILLFGATGSVGRAVAAELTARSHEVTAASRHGGPVGGAVAVAADATDPKQVAAAANGHDVVISAVSGTGGNPATLTIAASALVRGLRQATVHRLLVVGGGATMEIAPGMPVMESPQFPEEYKPAAYAQAAALALYRVVEDLDWTYISPAQILFPGERTGSYRRSCDALLTDNEGHSRISIADYAVALADELENPQAVRARIGVGY